MPRSAAGHAVASETEAGLCDEMVRQGVPHAHRSLHFRVALPSGETVPFDPGIVVHRGAVLFLVETLESAGGFEPVDVARAFLEQHSPEIVFVVVADRDRLEGLPSEAYDEAYDAADLGHVVARIREQDPDGFLRPFRKPTPPGSR